MKKCLGSPSGTPPEYRRRVTQAADVIVVLGCRVLPAGRPTATARRRAERAADAFFAGVAPYIITSGGRRWGEHAEALVLREALVDAGVPRARIAVELCSMTTTENAFFTARLLERRGARRAAIVTCDWHMPRALASFSAVGVEGLALPVTPPHAAFATQTRRRIHEALATPLDALSLRRLLAMSPP